MPLHLDGLIHVYIKYVYENIIGENVNCRLTYVALVGSYSVRWCVKDVHRSLSTTLCPSAQLSVSIEPSVSSIEVDDI